MAVFWILGPAFLLVGLYLLWYSGQTRRKIRRFSLENRLDYRKDAGRLSEILDTTFELDRPGLVRTFSGIRDVVDCGDTVALFRGVELLDLNVHGSADHSHHARVAVTFETSGDDDLFLLIDPDARCRSVLGRTLDPDLETLTAIREVVEGRPPRCPLSLTLRSGRGLLYLEPTVTGSVKPEDLEYLMRTARMLKSKLP